jgi:hypothetical protein
MDDDSSSVKTRLTKLITRVTSRGNTGRGGWQSVSLCWFLWEKGKAGSFAYHAAPPKRRHVFPALA